jgi:Ca2+-binding EF-hand superfamily protein
MSPISNISKDIISQSDTNSDSSLSIDELGVSEEQFSTLDNDGDGLVTQNEIASAIDSKLSSFDGEMPSKEEFESLISELGLQMPEPSTTKEANDFSSMIMSSYDSDSDSLLSASEVSILSDEEFSALDTNSDGSISTDELSSAYDQVTNTSSNSSESIASMPPPPSGGGSSSASEEEEYDELDTNKDGVVSQEEKNAALGIETADNSTVKDTIKLLLDTIKTNSSDSSENLDLSNFKNIMKMMNNQTNNSELNSYVKNLSNSNSSIFNYA